MKNKIVALFAGLVMALGLGVIAPAPAQAFAPYGVANHASSPRSLPVGTGRTVQAYVAPGTRTGAPSINYDMIYIPAGYYLVYNNTIHRRVAANNYGFVYVSATATGTGRLYRVT